MDKRSRNRYYMLARLNSVFNRHQQVWETEPMMVQVVDQLRQKQQLLDELLGNQERLMKPWKAVKDDQMATFIKTMLQLQGYVRTVAVQAENKALLTELSYSASIFGKRNVQQAYNIGRAIVEGAKTVAEELKQFSDGEDLLAQCEQLLLTVDGMALLAPAERRRKLKQVTALIADEQAEVSSLLKMQADSIMLRLGDKSPELKREYDANRIIPKYGTGRTGGNPEEPVIPELVDPVLPPTPPVGELGGGSLPGLPGGDAPPTGNEDPGEDPGNEDSGNG